MTQEVFIRGPSVGCLVIIITLCCPAYCTFAALAAAIRSLLLPTCEGPHSVRLLKNVLKHIYIYMKRAEGWNFESYGL